MFLYEINLTTPIAAGMNNDFQLKLLSSTAKFKAVAPPALVKEPPKNKESFKTSNELMAPLVPELPKLPAPHLLKLVPL